MDQQLDRKNRTSDQDHEQSGPEQEPRILFDALGQLTKTKGGTTGALWNKHTFDRYGNRTNVVAASGTAKDSSPTIIDEIFV